MPVQMSKEFLITRVVCLCVHLVWENSMLTIPKKLLFASICSRLVYKLYCVHYRYIPRESNRIFHEMYTQHVTQGMLLSVSYNKSDW